MKKTLITSLMLLIALSAGSSAAATYNGTVKLGGIVMFNEEGDQSAVQETYNIQDGFSISQLRLNGVLDMKQSFMINLHEINLRSRKAEALYRYSNKFRFTGNFDQHRQVYDPNRAVTSDRYDWRFGARYTPIKTVRISADYNFQNRDGNRLGFPSGTASVLGTAYDNTYQNARIEAEYRKNHRVVALAYDFSTFSNSNDNVQDRKGNFISARLYTPSLLTDKLTHMLRAGYGTRKLSEGDLEYKLMNFMYTGAYKPIWRVLLSYQFQASRVEDDGTGLQTDDFINNFEATYFHRFGRVFGGYAYETNDDDRRLTAYNSWVAGAVLKYRHYVQAEGSYSSRNKEDKEKLTLLKDMEWDHIRTKLEVRPIDKLVVGGRYNQREREFTDIGVKARGQNTNAYARFEYKDWGGLSGDYTYSRDDYKDLIDSFETRTDIVTARIDWAPAMMVDMNVPDIKLAAGVTYINVTKDIDLEKSFVFIEGSYSFKQDYFVEAKYNVYNYDDYLITSRYYTANVFWFNVGYAFSAE